MLSLPPLTLYIHFPWCVRKCPYCDFNSHEASGILPEAAYLEALKRDLQQALDQVQGRRLAAVFIGGGTPSLMAPAVIGGILDEAEHRIGFTSDVEITMEANPGTFEQEKFRGFHSAGVNRLSLGVQSFSNSHLRALGRIHDRATAVTAAASAHSAGFDNINLDLMHGLPQQTPAQALADLETALQLAPTHISWYQLTIEPNTVFHSRPPSLPDDDCLSDIQEAGEALLAHHGYRQYEISAYARGDHRSRHNLNYWEFGDYLGIGAGAHGKITLPQRSEVVRSAKTRKPEDYLARGHDFVAKTHTVDPAELPLEFFMNTLRLVEGVAPGSYPERTGLDFDNLAARWQQLQRQGLVEDPGARLATTPRGLRYLNSVLAALGE